LTTQLFFPGEEKNASDPIFEERTLMNIAEMESPKKAYFDFVVET
jgi:protocatechuate 3,4-dioxygenase beta subunit